MKKLHLFIIDQPPPSRIEVGPEDLSFLLYGARYSKENLAQAKEIVTAVNSHDGLLEALEKIASVTRDDLLGDPEYWGNKMVATASAALKAATKESSE